MKKYFNFRLFGAMMAIASLVACSKSPADDSDDPTTDPDPSELTFPEFESHTFEAGEEYTITFTPAVKWSMEADKSWIRFSYDGSQSSNPVGPAGQEDVTVTLIISEQPDLSESISGSVYLTLGNEKKEVMEIIQQETFTSDSFEVLVADSDEKATEITLEWDNNIAYFQSIITVRAPFDWVIAGDTEWMDTSNIELSGEASLDEPTRIIIRPNLAVYPAEDEQYTLRFENKTNSEIAAEVKVNIKSCANTLFVVDGYSLINGADLPDDGVTTAGVSSVNFSARVYGDEEPVILMPKSWYESSEVVYSNVSQFGRINPTTDFTVTLSESVEMGNFTQFNYKISTPEDGAPAMCSLMVFLKSGNAVPAFDEVNFDNFHFMLQALSGGKYGANGDYRLPEFAAPYLYGVITRAGGPFDASAIPFRLMNRSDEEFKNDVSFTRMSRDRELYSTLVDQVENKADLYSFIWNNCFDKNMNLLLHKIPNLAKDYDHVAYNADGTKSEWFMARNTGDLGEEVDPQWFIQMTPEDVPSRNAAGYVTITPKAGGKSKYIIEFEIVDPFTMVDDDSKASIGRMPSNNYLYSKFSEAISDKLNLYTFNWESSKDGKSNVVYHNDLLLDEYEYTCYNYDETMFSYDSERPTLSDSKSDWFTFHRAAGVNGEKPTWWIELVEGKEITYPAKGYVSVKDPSDPQNTPDSQTEESLFVIEFIINAE